MKSSLDRLVYMANQIARNFAIRGESEAAAATANHITRYWDPRMKAMILAYAGDALEPVTAGAVQRLREASPIPPP